MFEELSKLLSNHIYYTINMHMAFEIRKLDWMMLQQVVDLVIIIIAGAGHKGD